MNGSFNASKDMPFFMNMVNRSRYTLWILSPNRAHFSILLCFSLLKLFYIVTYDCTGLKQDERYYRHSTLMTYNINSSRRESSVISSSNSSDSQERLITTSGDQLSVYIHMDSTRRGLTKLPCSVSHDTKKLSQPHNRQILSDHALKVFRDSDVISRPGTSYMSFTRLRFPLQV